MLTARTPDPNDVHLEKLVRCDPRFKKILVQCLHQDPAHRYGGVSQLIEDLQALIPVLHSTPDPRTASPVVSPLVLGVNPMASVPTTTNMAGPPTSTTPMTAPLAGLTSPMAAPPSGVVQAGAAVPPPQVVVKNSSGNGLLIVILVVVAAAGGVMWYMNSKPKEEVKSTELSYGSRKIIALKDTSFEEVEKGISKVAKEKKLGAWEVRKKGKGNLVVELAKESEDGKFSLKLQNAKLSQHTGEALAPQVKYKLALSLAKLDAEAVEIGEDFWIGVKAGDQRIFWLKNMPEFPKPKDGKPQFQRVEVDYTMPKKTNVFGKKVTVVILTSKASWLVDDIEFSKVEPSS